MGCIITKFCPLAPLGFFLLQRASGKNLREKKAGKMGIFETSPVCSQEMYNPIDLGMGSNFGATRKEYDMTAYFDERAADWDQNPMRIERAVAVAGAIRARIALTPSTCALEYGCGTGLLSFALQQGGPLGQITLADNSAGMLAVLEGKICAAGLETQMHPLRLDLACDALPEQRFDLIYTLLTLHHIRETGPILTAFFQLLNPGGWLALADLDLEDGSFHEEPFDGHTGFDREEMRTALAGLGFGAIAFDTAYIIPKMRAGQPRSYPVFLATACKPPCW